MFKICVIFITICINILFSRNIVLEYLLVEFNITLKTKGVNEKRKK